MSVQAIDSGIDDLRFHGRNVDVDISGAITGAPSLVRTISGASTISMTLKDPNAKLLRKPFLNQKSRLELDGLDFTLGGIVWDDGTIPITVMDSAVARLKELKGPKKAYRDKVTRAQFISMLFSEAGVRLVSPEKGIVQPIAEREPEAKKKTRKNENRERGLDSGAKITVKGVKASASQLRIIEEILDECVREGADFRVMSMAIACATQESNMADLMVGDYAHEDSHGPFGQWDGAYSPWNRTVRGATRGFLKGTPAGDHYGILEYVRKNPDENFSISIADVQRPREDLRMEYQQWKEEANNTVREYLGGTEATSFEVETEQPYAFEVGKKENYWEAAKRLAKEVRWRLFISAGIGYYMTDDRLLASRPRLRVTSDFKSSGALNYPPGIVSVKFKIIPGKPVNSATIVCVAGRWKVPPGAVAIFEEDFGPGAGRWLTQKIETTLTSRLATVTLIRPSKPLPEPAPEVNTRTVTVSGAESGGSGAGAERAVKWAKSQVGVTEGSAQYRKVMSAMGRPDEAWCSDWIAYLMREVCGFRNIPSDFPNSACWSSWGGAKAVSLSNLKPGDIIGYGPGAHVGFYIGGGRCVSGNYSDAVTEHGLRDHPSPVAFAVRPKYRG